MMKFINPTMCIIPFIYIGLLLKRLPLLMLLISKKCVNIIVSRTGDAKYTRCGLKYNEYLKNNIERQNLIYLFRIRCG